jgi:D-alanyl-D-alanine carboxypeptidase/D-alanyl-D-alanine-endopeptidase (penicillin-binding protein 4)
MFFGAAITLCAQEIHGSRTVEQLQEQIAAHLAQPKFSAAIWGVKIVSLDSGKTVFEQHADRLMSPASNSKLYIAALGLDRLGGDYRFGTPMYAIGSVAGSGTLRGNLVVIGQGDPSWNRERLGTNFWTHFEPFAAILAHAGVRRVTGDLVADATFFRGPPTGSGWAVDDLGDGDAAMISALTLEDNLADARVEPGARIGVRCPYVVSQPGTGLVFGNQTVTVAPGLPAHLECFRTAGGPLIYLRGQLPLGGAGREVDVAVPQPADWFAAALKLALARHGISIGGQARGLAWPEAGTGLAAAGFLTTETNGLHTISAVKLGTVYSPPLREVVRDFMKRSQNLETDLLLAHLGEMRRASNAPPGQTSEEAGLAELGRFLAAIGVAPGEVQFDEGSGLSRNNLATANATVTLLQFMAKHREGDAFMAALPVAGVDGTLSQRFEHTAAAGNVRAKTGTLRWAQVLSGYVTTAAGERLGFSIMLNRFVAAPGHSGDEEIDPIVVMLADFAGRLGDDSR